MTLHEWTAEVTDDFTAAGFTVTEYQGFPLVAQPHVITEGARLIKFSGRWAVEKRIYGEGMLLLPIGAPGMWRTPA